MENVWKVFAYIIIAILYVALGYDVHIPTVTMCILVILVQGTTIKLKRK